MIVEIVLSIAIIIALLLFFGVSVQTILTVAVLILISLVVLAVPAACQRKIPPD